MKLKYLYLSLSLLLSLLIGAGSTWVYFDQYYKEERTVCKSLVKEAQEKTDALCGGIDLGGIRITEINCSLGEKEICFCGDPELLNIDLLK